MKDKKKESRRKFLDKGILGGAGLAAGLGALALSRNSSQQHDNTVRMIASDGSLYEVDKKHIQKMCSGKVSNDNLKKWIDEEQNRDSRKS